VNGEVKPKTLKRAQTAREAEEKRSYSNAVRYASSFNMYNFLG
jgi:hypothetical protein